MRTGNAGALHVTIGARDLELAGALGLAIGQEADLRRGAAHVEGHDMGQGTFRRDLGGEDGAACRARFDEADWEACRRLQRGEAATRHHQERGAVSFISFSWSRRR